MARAEAPPPGARTGRLGGPGSSLGLALCLSVLPGCTPRGAGGPEPRAGGDSAGPPIFTECARSVGLEFDHFTGAFGEYYIPEIMGSGCALLDYDGDGDLDVYAVQGARWSDDPRPPPGAPLRNRLFRNELVPSGRLAFSDVTEGSGAGDGGHGMGCAAGDYDGDGDTDLYVTNYGPNVLLRNEGGGTFTDVTAQAGTGDPRFSSSAAFLDYDRDGDLDLFVAGYVDFLPETSRQCTRLGGERDYCGPRSYDPIPDTLYRNEGDGTFIDVSEEAGIRAVAAYGLGVVCDDFDSDGWIDIFVANDATPNHLWRNLAGERFSEVALAAGVTVNAQGENEAGMGVACGDFDRDGDGDLLLTHERDETNTLYRNLGGGLFEDATAVLGLAGPSRPFAGFGTAWIDCDADGWLELVVTNGTVRKLPGQEGYPFRQPDQLYEQREGRFRVSGRSGFMGLEAGRGLAAGDIDNDGDVDFLVANNQGPLQLYRNGLRERGEGGGWLRLRLSGRRANPDACGAHVTVELEDGTRLWRRAGSDGSYLSASDPRLHFGLGRGARIAAVRVSWPAPAASDTAAWPEETWRGIEPASERTLVEGEGSGE